MSEKERREGAVCASFSNWRVYRCSAVESLTVELGKAVTVQIKVRESNTASVTSNFVK